MIVRRIGALILRRISQLPLPNRNSFHSSVASNRRFSNHFVDDEKEGSAIYRLALKFQRPTTVEGEPPSRNRISLIGTVGEPLNVMNTRSDYFGVQTRLNVKNPYDSDCRFKIRLQMWSEMGKICMEHVKPGDFIYVSGVLGSFSVATLDKQLIIYYKVTVTELSFVTHHGERSTTRECKELESEQDLGEAGMGSYDSQLYLWQVFFTNPFEWWDNRKSKKNPRQPDFKHKDTGEALWLNPNDPPWIKKQLQLLDSKLAEGLGDRESRRYRISEWEYDV
ncbi:hypothetical protein ERO13_D05G202800v2 [Gossypium hirsutum]|uniref:Protein OSB1, mitochondrial n=2 Tax=Gossypium TaxID=3633 RepID=A0A1U8MS06_GOSHI|nr:protein OSB1, mitochondrial [Gossypium hirsutum]KAB2030128.1 hypothetical protein ES319_D05G209900v1 [Gossypium barbadense]KAG4147109.1 hypothetical protein ERO13_D05G202800v2 [Gossypium hirsutum]KAG4147110.1 hypothetical protein ERO13_D05G202800v2 [Gossypium hirsutum]PPD74514.1 hypothetical protein GOBAR_DD28559 [Gossypium barbadense]